MEHRRDEIVVVVNGTHLCILSRPRKQPEHEPPQQQQSDGDYRTNEENSRGQFYGENGNDDDGDTAKTGLTASGAPEKSTTRAPGLSLRCIPMLLNQKEQVRNNNGANKNDNSKDNIHINRGIDSNDPGCESDITDESPTYHLPLSFINGDYWREFTIDNQLIEDCYNHGNAYSSDGTFFLQGPHYLRQQQQQQQQQQKRNTSLPQSPLIGGSNSDASAQVHVNDNGGIYLLTRTCTCPPPCVNNEENENNNRREEENQYDTFTLLLGRCGQGQSQGQGQRHHEGEEEEDEIKEFLRINNRNSGYIVADYFGCNALEQILFLPSMNNVSGHADLEVDVGANVDRSSIVSNMSKGDNLLHQMKCALLHILIHAIMTDGNSLFYHQNGHESKEWEQKKIQTFHEYDKLSSKTPLQSAMPHSSFSSLIVMPTLKKKFCKDTEAQSSPLQKNQTGIGSIDNIHVDKNDSKKRKIRNIDDQNQNKKSSKTLTTTSSPLSPPHELENNGYDKEGSSQVNMYNTKAKSLPTVTTETSRPNWKEKIRSGLQKRLQFELQQRQRQQDIQLIKRRVLQQNRMILQKLSLTDGLKVVKRDFSNKVTTFNVNGSSNSKNNPTTELNGCNSIYDGNTTGHMMLEMVRIRHKIHTLDGMSSSLIHQNALCVKLYLEVDILLHHKGYSTKDKEEGYRKSNNNQHKQEQISNVTSSNAAIASNHLLDVQLSCSLDSSCNGEKQKQKNIAVKTLSGVVPHLRKGECVTIVSAVHVSGIQLTNGLSTLLSFTLNAFWRHGAISTLNMKGIALGSFIIPVESIIMNEHIHNEVGFGKTSLYETDFSKLLLGTQQEQENEIRTRNGFFPSRAIFEYRKPQVLIIDVSKDVSVDIIGEWKTKIACMNDNFGNGNHIDIYHDSGKMQIKVTALAESPEHRASLVELIIKYLPENTKVVDSFVEPIKESSIVESMLRGVKEEVELIDNHISMAKIRPGDLSQLAFAQSRTDELAARLIMLNKKSDQ